MPLFKSDDFGRYVLRTTNLKYLKHCTIFSLKWMFTYLENLRKNVITP